MRNHILLAGCVAGAVALLAAPGARKAFTERNGTLVFEAEDCSRQKNYARVANAEASGGAVMQVLENIADAAATLDFDVAVSSPGTRYLWIRSHALDHLNNGLYVKLDGEFVRAPKTSKYAGVHDIFVKRPGWFWEPEWQGPGSGNRDKPVQIELTSGRHVISIVNRKVERPLIDKIVLTMTSEQPKGTGPTQ